MRYHLTLVRMAIIKKSKNNKCWRGCGQKVTLLCCWWECIGAATMENSMEVPQKTENRTTIWSNNPTLGHVSGQKYNLKRYMHPYVHSSNIYNSQDMETTQMSIYRWMDKKDVVWASLVAQSLGISLPMQRTRVRTLSWEDPTCCGATGPVSHNYWACASGACAPQQERPRQWEARVPRWRVAPARRN